MAGTRGATTPSMQELIRRRRRAGFVGRRGELALFRENLDLSADDERRHFVFHIRGNAGVGKTSLLRELEQVARERNAVAAIVDESVNSVPEAMAAIAAQFAQQGCPLKALDKLLATYRQRRYEAETAAPEPETAAGGVPQPPSAGSMAAAQVGLIGFGLVPGVGALAGGMDPTHLAQGADRLRAALGARFRNPDDVQLVLDPLRVLTPVLVAEVERVASDRPWVTLFFDTYERTGVILDSWLRDLITTDRYGTLPANVVVTLAGQGRLDSACWADFADIVTDVPLEPFTETEARQLLAAKGVTDEEVVRDVLRVSGRLPVLVSTLAENPGAGADPSATAVERFLKWERDPERRAAALLCALPRRVDEDVLKAALERGETDGLFGWLAGLPFVSVRQGRAQYHDVVRGPMLRLQRHSSPRGWTEAHSRLARAFADWRETAAEGVAPDELWDQEAWVGPRLEESYHLLCAQPRAALPRMLRDGVDACEQGGATARRWARVLAEAGEAADSEELRGWGRDAQAALEGESQGIALLGLLLSRAGFDAADQVTALVVRGMLHRRADGYASARADYDRALALDPACARAHYGQAMVLQSTGDYEAALAALHRADTHSPDTAWILEERGEVHRILGRYEQAVADCDRALAGEPDNDRALATRGYAVFRLGREREALADFDRAIELDPEYVWALIRRSQVRLALGDEAGALADLDRAEEADPASAWVVGERSDIHRRAGRYEAAIADLDRALSLGPEYVWALGSRGAAKFALHRTAAALEDFGRAIALDPGYTWGLTQRAEIHRRSGDREAQFADLDLAVAQGDDTPWALAERGNAFRRLRRYEEALADLGRAISLNGEYGWALGIRGQALLECRRFSDALADLEQAVLLLPRSAWVLEQREQVYGKLRTTDGIRARCDASDPEDAAGWIRRASARTACEQFAEALADYDRALELDPDHAWARVRRAWLRGRLGDRAGQLADLDRLVAGGRDLGWALAERVLARISAGLLRGALADLNRCAALGYSPAWTEGRIAAVFLYLGRPGEALAVLERMRPGDRDGDLALVAEALRGLGRFDEARETAERVRGFNPEAGLFHLAMAESRMRGTESDVAARLWRELAECETFVADPQAPDAEELGQLLVLACVRGDWDAAAPLLDRLLGAGPDWSDLADVCDTLGELAVCPGADMARLGELLARVTEARNALATTDDL
ncbi:tetratricopeptide repeat protein [Streptomyces sp. NPDC000410]|uniref:tetratricopeptide repeat protein n=1 Tax=Streptomyces sp. NPDC000410 TaxID=3154254 RepID=UPI003333EB4E